MLLNILIVLFVILVLGFIVSLFIPVARENGIYGYLAVAICLLNVIIQAVNICTS